MFNLVSSHLTEYMIQKLNIDESEVPTMCFDLYKKYGTTMAGLKVFYSFVDKVETLHHSDGL